MCRAFHHVTSHIVLVVPHALPLAVFEPRPRRLKFLARWSTYLPNSTGCNAPLGVSSKREATKPPRSRRTPQLSQGGWQQKMQKMDRTKKRLSSKRHKLSPSLFSLYWWWEDLVSLWLKSVSDSWTQSQIKDACHHEAFWKRHAPWICIASTP